MPEKSAVNVNNEANVLPERRVFHYMIALAIVTTLLSVVLTTLEVSRFPKPVSAKKETSFVQGLTMAIKAPHPAIDVLPEMILQYETKTRQDVPGAKYPSAEAIYEWLDSNAMLATPMNSYVRVTYFPSTSEAQKDIESSLRARFPAKNTTIRLDGTIVKTGFDEKQSSYLMGWTKEGYSIKIITNFLDGRPVDKGAMILTRYATPVAKGIIAGKTDSHENVR